MQDPILVQYKILEELFSQKQATPSSGAPAGEEKKEKAPTEVLVHYFSLLQYMVTWLQTHLLPLGDLCFKGLQFS